jgi:hypothetical protein
MERSERVHPANAPKTKNRIAGAIRLALAALTAVSIIGSAPRLSAAMAKPVGLFRPIQ